MKSASQYRGARRNEARARGLLWRNLENFQGRVILPSDDGKRVIRAKQLKVMRKSARTQALAKSMGQNYFIAATQALAERQTAEILAALA